MMTKTAMLIFTWPGGNATVARNWPWWRKNCTHDFFGATTTDGITTFPEPIPQKGLGISGYLVGNNLVTRPVNAFRWFLEDPIFNGYTHCWLNEHDGLFIREAPKLEGEIYAHLGGGGIPGLEQCRFYHLPWVMNRSFAERFVTKADELIAAGRTQRGFGDVFFGLVMRELGIDPVDMEPLFSINAGETDARWAEADRCIRDGKTWYLHGIKTASQIERIEKALAGEPIELPAPAKRKVRIETPKPKRHPTKDDEPTLGCAVRKATS